MKITALSSGWTKAAALLALLLLATGAAAEGKKTYIVIYKGGANAAASARFASPAMAMRARSTRPAAAAIAPDARNVKDLWVVNGYALEASSSTIASLSLDPDVEAVVENFEVRAPTVETTGAAQAKASENWGLAKIGALTAWSAFGVTGRGVRVGHLDTGVSANHPDLAGKIAAWAEFDGSGNRVPGSVPHDSGVHGTHTAGTIVGGAASGAAIGVAPGAALLSAMVLNGGSGTLMQVLSGMQWVLDPDGNPATDDGARVLSMSLGAAGQYAIFQLMTERLLAAGILPVFAIGNSGAGNADAPGNCAGAVSVGATTFSDNIASFSGGGQATWYGKVHVKPELAAPGYGIPSSVPGGGYLTFSGTSMATPHVAGAAALLLEANPALTVEQLRDTLAATAQDLGAPGHDNRFGAGRLDVMAALARVSRTSLVQGTTRGEDGPMPASLRVKDSQGRLMRTARADESGRFALSLPEGSYTVEASFGQARGLQKPVTVRQGAVSVLNFTLAAASGSLDNVLPYPNPFRSGTDGQMVFDGLPSDAVLDVYTITGEKVTTLNGAAGGTLAWNGKNAAGETLASGAYYYLASRYDAERGWEHKRGTLAVLK